MSQVELKLVAALEINPVVNAIVSGRVYPVILPQGCVLPAVTYQRISGGQDNTLAGYSGRENPRIQVDCWGDGYGAVKNLALAVRRAVTGATSFTAVIISDMDLYEDEAKIHRVSMDFSIWNDEQEA